MKIQRRRRPPRPRRDEDYRGQKRPVDFSKFVYEVRRGKPGALEVLQDALNTYFPKQFQKAQEEATPSSKQHPNVVLFNARVARYRFMSYKDVRSLKGESPFRTVSYGFIVQNGYLPANTAIVWSSKTKYKISEKLRRFSRRRREPFFDPTHPKGPRWYGRIKRRY
jgi:hypothetical protein